MFHRNTKVMAAKMQIVENIIFGHSLTLFNQYQSISARSQRCLQWFDTGCPLFSLISILFLYIVELVFRLNMHEYAFADGRSNQSINQGL
jgi:Ca2+/H+ antiporter